MKKEKRYFEKLGFRGVFLYWLKKYKWKDVVVVDVPGYPFSMKLRAHDADIGTFEKIFVDVEYDFTFGDMSPKVIVDVGANIGASPVFFAHKYPDAAVYTMEPENKNFALLEENTQGYKNIKNYKYGLWYENKTLSLENKNIESISFTLSEDDQSISIKGVSLDCFMKEQGIEYIDILKIDIEGAEKDIFARKPKWLDKVGLLIVELHDRKVKGCSRAFFSAIDPYAKDEHFLGDNIFIQLKSANASQTGSFDSSRKSRL